MNGEPPFENGDRAMIEEASKKVAAGVGKPAR
jgi:hypothetical protein